MKLVLLTNDDGFSSPGIQHLKEYLSKKYDVYMVAPDSEKSAVSMSLSLNHPLRIHRLKEKEYRVDGTPSDCVTIAIQKILPRYPDVVVSGMNLGENLAEDILFSGTVGGAFCGHLYGIPSLAVSLIANRDRVLTGEFNFQAGVEFTGKVLEKILTGGTNEIFCNLNVPFHNNGQIVFTTPGSKKYRPDIVESIDPRGRTYYWIGTGNPQVSDNEGSDIWAVRNNMVSLTPLRYRLSDPEIAKELSWNFDET